LGQLTFDDATPPSPRTLSVSELVQRASRRLEAAFGDVWVEGEVSNLKTPASGHYYFTLKDARAQLPVVMFRLAVSRLEFRVEDGQRLRCRGRVSIYDRQGRFQLTAVTAEPAGVGALQLAFEQLKQKLEAEGLFDPRHKKPLPALPTTVALVTSPTGAALRDMVRVLHARFPVRVVLSPTPVQGSDAPGEIVRALRRADRLGADVIIVGRGGGSLEDLRAFNHEGVARAIFSAVTPIISAVGHEVDVTIADLVADRRAPTPSAAAEMAVPEERELADQLRVHRLRLGRSMSHLLRRRELALERLDRRLGSPAARLDRARLALDEAAAELQASFTRVLGVRRERAVELRSRLAAQEPRARLARDRAALSQLERELSVRLESGLARRRSRLEQLSGRLEALSPLGVLDRGYGLVLDANRSVIRDISTVAPGQLVTVRLAGGELSCRVEEVREKLEEGVSGVIPKTG
jgi:exodeoxyribonuclease VII large subunit